MISRYEMSFMALVQQVMKTGFYQKNERTGIATKRISHGFLQCDLQKEFPILTSKHCFWKSAVDEILWIYSKQSNNINDLNSHIWDQWADADGSIGKAYGYQVKKHDQVKKVLETLRSDPSSRRAVMDLWQCDDIPEMNLTPCVYTSVWDIVDDCLNVMVTSRSCDLLVGGVFNVIQYAVLCHLFAKDLGVKPGIITFNMADVHIYENQFTGCIEWLTEFKKELAAGRLLKIQETFKNNPEALKSETEKLYKEIHEEHVNANSDLRNMLILELAESLGYDLDNIKEDKFADIQKRIDNMPDYKIKSAKIDSDTMKSEMDMKNALTSPEYINAYNCKPVLKLVHDKKSFFDFTIDDIKLENYHHLKKIDFPVAK